MIACGQGAAQMNIGKGGCSKAMYYHIPRMSITFFWSQKYYSSYDEYIINEQRKLTLLTMQKQYIYCNRCSYKHLGKEILLLHG